MLPFYRGDGVWLGRYWEVTDPVVARGARDVAVARSPDRGEVRLQGRRAILSNWRGSRKAGRVSWRVWIGWGLLRKQVVWSEIVHVQIVFQALRCDVEEHHSKD